MQKVFLNSYFNSYAAPLLTTVFFLSSLLVSWSSQASSSHNKKITDYSPLITAIKNNDISALLELMSDYPWVESYILDILQTDLSFVDSISNSDHKIKILYKLFDKADFAPLQKNLLDKIIETQTRMNISNDEAQKALYELTNEKINLEDCRPNFERAKKFREFRKFELSLKLFDANFKCSTDVEGKLRALNQIVLTHKLKERGKVFIKASDRHYNFALEQFKKKNITATQMNRIGIAHVRTLWTYQSLSSAEKTLDELIPILKPHISLQTAYWIKARLFEERSNLTESLKYIDLALAEKSLNLDDLLTLHWQKFWDNYKSNNPDVAEQALRDAIKVNDPEDSRSRLYYWLKKMLQKKEQTEDVKKEIANIEDVLLKRYPLSFYAALVRKHRNIDFPSSQLENLESAAYKKRPVSLNFTLYKQLHEVSVVATQAYLKNYYKHYKNKISKSERLFVKRLLARNGDTYNLFLDIKLKPELCMAKDSPCADLFPTPYKTLVTQSAQKHQVPAELVFSIIRQESVFNPIAKSWADARGLMQLLPSLAKDIAPKVGVEYKNSLDLYQPEKNIQLGSFHLRSLYNRNSQSLVMALSGYNADEKKAQVWFKTRFKGNWLEFIEEIPYKETRNYNKLVLRNFIIYSYLNNNPIGNWFPEGL